MGEIKLMRTLVRRLAVGVLALAIAACSAQGGGTLQTGMTTDQAVSAMGQPDLRDSVPDPNHSGATLQRYTWLGAEKSAVFSSDNRLASIQDIGPAPSTTAQAEAAQAEPPSEFDPINTPLNYAFYPFRAALIYIGAGINCVGGGGCRRPRLPSVNHG